MIKMDNLKPILEKLLDGRDDAADVIEQVIGIDEDTSEVEALTSQVADLTSQIEKLNADITAKDTEYSDKIKKLFFGEKADTIDESIPEMKEDEVNAEDITIDDLFTESNNVEKEDE